MALSEHFKVWAFDTTGLETVKVQNQSINQSRL